MRQVAAFLSGWKFLGGWVTAALVAAAAGAADGPAAPAPAPAVQIPYEMAGAGFVTLVIDDAHGRRVRNLVGGERRTAGAHVEAWDGRDDAGNPVPPDDYRWHGLSHGGITSHFVAAFNSPGNPPWNTHERPARWHLRASGNGGWLSDHGRPHCVHAAGARIFLGSPIAEAGHSVIEVDMDGRKRWGTLWLGLSGAHALAVDGNVLFVAGERGWMKDSLAVHRLNLDDYAFVPNPPELRQQRTDASFVKEKSADFSDIRGLAVTPQFIVLSLADTGRLACFDRDTAAHVKDVPLPQAGAILGVADGGLLGISGEELVRIDLAEGNHRLIFRHGIREPGGLAVDAGGRVFIGDRGPTEQCVKVFSAAGEFVQRIGAQGGRHEGRFDPLAMSRPAGLAIDARDRLWVCEDDVLPKRVSVWTTDGSLVRDFVGPPHYGGGGGLEPARHETDGHAPGNDGGRGWAGAAAPLRGFFRGMAFSLSPWPETSRLEAVTYRPEEHRDLPYPDQVGAIPHTPVWHGDRLHLVNDDGWGLPGVFIGEVRGDRLLPRVIFGGLDTLWKTWRDVQPDFLATLGPLDGPPPQGVFLWQDADGDGRAEPGEVEVRRNWRFGSLWALRATPTLRLLAREGDRLAVVAPASGDGPLRYDLGAATFIPLPDVVRTHSIGAACPDPDGHVLVNCGGGGNQGDPANVLLSLASDGRIRWTYPNPYPANWHNSPLPRPGAIQHTLNAEGWVSLGADQGTVFQLNGNKGVRYLFTGDGLFVTSLFGDMRTAPLQQSILEVSAGQRLDGHSLGDECFFGWLGRVPDGRILQIAGKDASNVCEVRGLETLKRLPGGTIRLDRRAPPLAELSPAERGPIQAIAAGGFGFTTGWEKLARGSFPGVDPVAHFAFGHTRAGLRVWLDVRDETPFENRGGDLDTLFHSGDAVDLRWAADPTLPAARTRPGPGDLRFVIAMHGDRPVVVRYRYVDPESTADPRAFASPAGVEHVAEVRLIEDARVQVVRHPGRYEVTVDLPWAALGAAAPVSGIRRGDVGVIFGDSAGTRAVRRCYHFDSGSQEVSDIPAEVRVVPARWGDIRF